MQWHDGVVQLRSALTCEIDTVVTLGTVVVNLAPVPRWPMLVIGDNQMAQC